MTEQPTELAAYQHVDGQLQRVPITEVSALRGRVYFAPLDGDHDQGDDPNICPGCGAGRHDECRDGAELGGDDIEVCDCRDGECGGGEWTELGALTVVNGVPVDSGRAWIAPLGTPPPGPFAGLTPHLAIRDEAWDERPVGPPIPVRRTENRADGTYVEVSIGPAHPAYAAVRDGLTDSLSIGNGPVRKCADNEPSVKLDPVRGGSPTPSRTVPVVSPAVNNGLGREHVANRLAEDPAYRPGPVTLPPELGGPVVDTGADPDVTVERRPLNRAERRALARRLRRG